MAISLGDLSKVPAKQKAFLAALLCVLVLFGYYSLYYKETADAIKSQEARLNEVRSKVKEQEFIARDLPSFRQEVARLEQQLGILLEQLPNSAEIPSLLRNVSDLGRESGLEFKKFAPKAEVSKEFYAEIPVAISVEGDFHSFATFADKVGHLSRIVNLSDINFGTPKVTPDGYVTVGISCTATTYRFIEQAAKPAVPDAAAKPKPGAPAADKGGAK